MRGRVAPDKGDTPWVYGRHPVKEALAKGKAEKVYVYKGSKVNKDIWKLAKALGVPVTPVDMRFFNQFKGNHQGVAAKLSAYDYWDLGEIIAQVEKEKGVLLLLDRVNDPRNLGASLRSAAAFGVSGVLIPKKGAVGITPTVIKASAGTLFNLRIGRVGGLASTVRNLSEKGFQVIALDARGELPLPQLQPSFPCLLMVGGEEGLRETLRREAHLRVSIPMEREVESLNLSVALSIALYHIYLRRKEVGL